MSRWSRSILIVGCLAVLALVVIGLAIDAGESYATHALAGLGATLLAVFAQVWVLIFLLASGRLLARMERAGEVSADVLGEAARLRRRSWPWAVLAVLAVLAALISGGGVSSTYVSPPVHRAAFWLAVALQAVALWAEGRNLAAHDGLLARVKNALP